MSARAAQLWLAAMFLGAAVIFDIVGHSSLAVGLVGAVIGQGAAVTVQKAANGNGK